MNGCFAPLWQGAYLSKEYKPLARCCKEYTPLARCCKEYTPLVRCCNEYTPLARGQGAYWRLTRPSNLCPLLVPPLTSPLFNCPKCTLLTPPLSQCPCSPGHWAALKLKAQLGHCFKRVLVPSCSEPLLCFAAL